jgi:hypothetical protein
MDAPARLRTVMRGYAQSFIDAIRAKLLLTAVTMFLLVLLLLHLKGKIAVDGWAILLFVLAVIPWSLPSTISAFQVLSDAFGRSNFKSLQFGQFKIEQLEKRVSEQAQQIDEQRRILDDLTLYSMAFYICEKLKYLSLGTSEEHEAQYGEYKYVPNEVFDHDLRYLRDHGYLELFQIGELTAGENLVGKLKVTEMGRRFVELNEAKLRQRPEVIVPASVADRSSSHKP